MTTTIKFAGYQGDKSVHTRAANVFCDALRSEAGDSVDIHFAPNIVQNGFNASDLLTKTESGELDGCYFSSSYLADRVPELGLFDQHFVVPDRRHAYAVLDGALGTRLAKEVEQATGFAVLGYWDNGIRHISTAHGPLHHPRDCMGLKIRTLSNDQHKRVFRALGFEPRSIDVGDLPEAVASFAVDAQENPLTNIYNFGLHKTHRYITLTQHLLGVALVLFNKQAVARWPDNLLSSVQVAIADATAAQRRFALEDDTFCYDALAADGCQLVTLTDEQRAEFSAATTNIVAAQHSQFKTALVDLFNEDLAGVCG